MSIFSNKAGAIFDDDLVSNSSVALTGKITNEQSIAIINNTLKIENLYLLVILSSPL